MTRLCGAFTIADRYHDNVTLDSLSDFNARRRKVFSFTRAFALGGGRTSALRAASGVDSQASQRLKEQEASERALKAIKDELHGEAAQ